MGGDARLAEDEGGSGFIKSGGAGNWLGSAQVTKYLGRYPGWRCAVAGGLLAAGRGQVGTRAWREAGGNAGLGRRGVVSSAHLDVWVWDRHLGPAHLGHWGPLSWASPKVAEPMGVPRAQQQEPWKRASIPRWSMVIALGGRPCLDPPRFLPADRTAGRYLKYMSGNLGMKGQGPSRWPARLGKLLQATRDLNLPSLGYRPTRQAIRCLCTFTLYCQSACLPCLFVCDHPLFLPDSGHHRAIVAASIRTCHSQRDALRAT